jgi:hypothetical protein
MGLKDGYVSLALSNVIARIIMDCSEFSNGLEVQDQL